MKCQSCSTDNREGRKFCSGCGGRLAITCASCGAFNEVGESFCGECGAKVGVPTLAPSAPPPRETPKHLADKIRQSKSAVEGERKQVTVLFADVKGSMDGKAGEQTAGEALATAAELIERTGSKSLAPHLLEWRAEHAAVLGDETARKSLLNQAIEEYDSIGAPLQAERLRREIGS